MLNVSEPKILAGTQSLHNTCKSRRVLAVVVVVIGVAEAPSVVVPSVTIPPNPSPTSTSMLVLSCATRHRDMRDHETNTHIKGNF